MFLFDKMLLDLPENNRIQITLCDNTDHTVNDGTVKNMHFENIELRRDCRMR